MPTERTFSTYTASPSTTAAGGLLALDITDIIEKERSMHRQQMEAYREAILAGYQTS